MCWGDYDDYGLNWHNYEGAARIHENSSFQLFPTHTTRVYKGNSGVFYNVWCYVLPTYPQYYLCRKCIHSCGNYCIQWRLWWGSNWKHRALDCGLRGHIQLGMQEGELHVLEHFCPQEKIQGSIYRTSGISRNCYITFATSLVTWKTCSKQLLVELTYSPTSVFTSIDYDTCPFDRVWLMK